MKGAIIILLIIVLSSCNNETDVRLSGKDPDIFAHYDIQAEEGGEMAVCLIRFYTDRSRSTTLNLDEPSHVELDGEPLLVDSSRFSGAFYEMQVPISNFAGQHTISFTSPANRVYAEDFSFTPLRLHTNLNNPIPKSDLVLKLEGLNPEDEIRIVMLDTSFTSDGINQLEPVIDGQLTIKSDLLKTLKSGPVILEISKEAEFPLTSGLNGILTTTYTLKRNLILRD